MNITVRHYLEVNLTSKHFKKCWTKIDPNSEIGTRLSADPSLVDSDCAQDLFRDPDFMYSETEAMTAGGFNTLQSIVGSILNCMVILAILRSTDLRKEYLTPCILSIAITDFLFSIVVLPVMAITFFQKDIPVSFGCSFSGFIGYTLFLISALNLLVIAALRCFAVYFPRKTMEKPFVYVCRAAPILGWVVAIIFMLPTLIGKFGQFGLECRTFRCKHIDMDIEGNVMSSDPTAIYFTVIIASGTIMLLLNVATVLRVSTQSIKMYKTIALTNKEEALKTLKKERKVGKMVTVISIAFLVVYLPSCIAFIFYPDAVVTQEFVMVIVHILQCSLVVIDPLAYMISHATYREEIKKMFEVRRGEGEAFMY